MTKRRSTPKPERPRRASLLRVAQPPRGFSYTREQDERPARLKALHQPRPTAKCAELAQLYEARYHVALKPAQVAAALRQAGVRLREVLRQELRERPRRLAKILATMRYPTRDKLADAYQKAYGVALPYDCVSIALRQRGIKLIEPVRKPDRDEVEERPLRLYELAEAYPKLTQDQLGQMYGKRYGIRLPPSTVAIALHSADVYRHRLVDPEEFADRTERLRALAEEQPEFQMRELAAEYERIYDVSLHPVTVQQTLNKLGIYRLPPVDAAEVARRPQRLAALTRKYPAMSYAELAGEYERRFKTALTHDLVEQALRSLGIYRQRPLDRDELTQRPERLKRLLKNEPRATEPVLAELYTKQYGISLKAFDVSTALHTAGIVRHRVGTAEERKKRPGRLKKLSKTHPNFTNQQLAQAYEKLHGVTLTPSRVTRALNQAGIYKIRLPTAAVLRLRIERLQALAHEYPKFNKTELFEEYRRRYGEELPAHSTRATLRRRGGFLSRSQITAERVKRLQAIAKARPELSKAEVVREYGRRYGETLNIPSMLTTLRRLGVWGDGERRSAKRHL